MKKVPSYPKITTKTNITFTQTQNININSPKNLSFSPNVLSAKKMFKAASNNLNSITNKLNRQRQKSNNFNITTKNISSTKQKSKSKILSQKGSKSTTQLLIKRENSSSNFQFISIGNLKQSKNYDPEQSIKHQDKQKNQDRKKIQTTKSQGKEEIKKLEQKLKLLQKKIDTLKSSASKRKKQLSSSQRTNSKVKDNNSLVKISQYKQPMVEAFQKKKTSSNQIILSNKVLKKSYSDKNMIKSRPPKMPHKMPIQSRQNYEIKAQQKQFNNKDNKEVFYQENKQNQKQHQQEVIHKFVTQVQKNPKMFQRHHTSQKPQSTKIFYYITNLSMSLSNTDFMIYREHLVQSLQTFNYMQNVRKPSLKELQKHSVNLNQDHKKHKYTIVLDLDQTLIHCNQSTDTPYDVCLKIKFPTGQKIDAGVNIRPHAHKLLKELSQFCEIIVFTASHQCYANVVLDHLDPHKKLISHRLFRNHCWQTEEGIYIKDLRVLKNRDLQNILLVDNAAYSYFYQLENGIPIIPFYDDKQDDELLHLISYIKTLIKLKQNHSNLNTIKKANNNYFKLTQYIKYKDLQKLTKTLYESTIKEFETFNT